MLIKIFNLLLDSYRQTKIQSVSCYIMITHYVIILTSFNNMSKNQLSGVKDLAWNFINNWTSDKLSDHNGNRG